MEGRRPRRNPPCRDEADCLCDAEVDAALSRLASDITALRDHQSAGLCRDDGGLVLADRLLPRLPFPLEVELPPPPATATLQGTLLDWLVSPTHDLHASAPCWCSTTSSDEGRTLAAIIDFHEGAQEVFSAVLVPTRTTNARPGRRSRRFHRARGWPTASVRQRHGLQGLLAQRPGIYALKGR